MVPYDFKHGNRNRLGTINQWRALLVPATAVAPRAFAVIAWEPPALKPVNEHGTLKHPVLDSPEYVCDSLASLFGFDKR